MQFRDEFEYEDYSVEVQGEVLTEDGVSTNELKTVTITDALGTVVDEDDDVYDEIYTHALERDYGVEEHGADFAQSDAYVDGFLKE